LKKEEKNERPACTVLLIKNFKIIAWTLVKGTAGRSNLILLLEY